MKLITVIGIRTMKYSFSVALFVLKDTWILPNLYIIRISKININNMKVSCHADKKLAYFE